jgi:hypothetical protein
VGEKTSYTPSFTTLINFNFPLLSPALLFKIIVPFFKEKENKKEMTKRIVLIPPHFGSSIATSITPCDFPPLIILL